MTKRAVGLLRNSRRAIVTLMNSVDEQLNRAAKENSGSEVAVQMGLTLQLHQRVPTQAPSPSPELLVQSMQQGGLVSMEILAPLVLHLGIIDEYLQPLNAASERLYRAIGSLDEVRQIRDGCTREHDAVATRLSWQLWASYVLAAGLVVCALLLARSASRATAVAMEAESAALRASRDTQEKIQEIGRAVTLCNGALEKLSRGDFASRIDESFSDELEELRHAGNRTADRVQHTMKELENVMVAMQ